MPTRYAFGPTKEPRTRCQSSGNIKGEPLSEPLTTSDNTAPVKFVLEILAPVKTTPLKSELDRLVDDRLAFEKLVLEAPDPVNTPLSLFISPTQVSGKDERLIVTTADPSPVGVTIPPHEGFEMDSYRRLLVLIKPEEAVIIC
jgi:hypothetical protein